MEFKDSDRLGAKLYAINMRVAELDHEVQRAQVRVSHLEAQLEDARLAQLMGQRAGDPAEIAPELERSRGSLESQREYLDLVKKNQWKARVHLTVTQAKERMDLKKREA
ncbi:MAG: hypothetical protein K0Q72_5117, partial [Armatimonadetes bacterium]|nr:hypothetical protein [Armatimonadota bacterium]